MACQINATTLSFIKIDFNGNCQSIVSYACPYTITPSGLIRKSDGTIQLITNFTQSTPIGFAIVDIDSNANIISTKRYNSQYLGASGFLENSNNEFYLAAALNYTGPALIKCDSTGHVIWNKTYAIPNGSGGGLINRTYDNGFIICSLLSNVGPSVERKAQLIKLDSSGTVQWTKIYTDSLSNIEFVTLRTVGTNGYILSGSSDPFSTVASDAFLIKTDLAGNVLWSYKYGGPDSEYSNGLVLASDSGFIFGGSTNGIPNSSYTTGYLAKTDSLGHIGCFEDTFSIHVETDTSTIVVGSASISIGSITFTPATIALPTETSDVGHMVCTSTNVSSIENRLFVDFFPNPVRQSAKLEIKNSNASSCQLKIFNSLGSNISTRKITESQTEIDCSYLPNGIYFYQLSSSENNATGKFVVAH